MDEFFNTMLDFNEGASSLTAGSILLCLLVTFALSQAVGWIYVWTHRGISYSASLSQSLIVLSLIVALVMLVIGNNIARAFGLFGALALIRFRTPVKDSKDTVFLFLAVAIGIATGTGNIMAGLIGTAVICLVFVYLSLVRFGNRLNHDGLFRLSLPLGGEAEAVLQTVLNHYCDTIKLLHMREAGPGRVMEYAYQVKLIDPRYGSQLMAEVERIEGVHNVSFLMQDGEAAP